MKTCPNCKKQIWNNSKKCKFCSANVTRTLQNKSWERKNKNSEGEEINKLNSDLQILKLHIQLLKAKANYRNKKERCPYCNNLMSIWAMRCYNCSSYIEKNFRPNMIQSSDLFAYDFDENYSYSNYLSECIMEDEIEQIEEIKRDRKKMIEYKNKIKKIKKRLRGIKHKQLIKTIWISFMIAYVICFILVIIAISKLLFWLWGFLILLGLSSCILSTIIMWLFWLMEYFFDNDFLLKLRQKNIFPNIAAFSFMFIIIFIPLMYALYFIITNYF